MEKKRSGLFSGFGVLIIWGIIGSAVLSIIASFLCHPKFLLNENQLLYLFSSMAQIIGSVFGLTLTAYVFFVDKFRESAKMMTLIMMQLSRYSGSFLIRLF